MGFRSCCLGLAVLSALEACGASPAKAAPITVTGTAGFTLAPDRVSSIPLDLKEIPLCNFDRPGGYLVTCIAVVKPEDSDFQATFTDAGAVADALQLASAEPLSTPCGLWQVEVTLDPTRTQPLSPMVFDESSPDPGSGLFAGVLKMETNLHFTNLETGQTVDFPLPLGLGLAGPWTLAPAGTCEAGEPARLLPLAQPGPAEVLVFEDCFPVWILGRSTFTIAEDSNCQICPLPIMPVEQVNCTDPEKIH